MGSFYAELHLESRAYPVRRADYSIHQEVDGRGRPRSKKRHGPLHLTLDVPNDEVLPAWAATPHKPLPGRVVFYDLVARVAHETIAFAAGECVRYVEDFESSNVGPGAYVCQLTITAPVFELRAGGPAAPLAPVAARHWAGGAGEAPTPGLRSAPGLPAAAGWLTDLETVMGPEAGVRTLVASWVAGGLSQEKLTSAMRGAVDKRLVFERLRDATLEKGIYQQRVIVDDYENIPGVNKQSYAGGNSLPQKKLLANDFLSDKEKMEFAATNKFGENNQDLDLPDYRTATFTRKTKLIKLNPGTPLYRVTDPGGEGGPWWTLKPPKNLAEVIGGTAVMPEWNGFSSVIEAIVPDDGEPFYVWSGPAAAQPVSLKYPDKKNNGYSLAGGEEQVFLPNPIKNRATFKGSFQNKTATLKSW